MSEGMRPSYCAQCGAMLTPDAKFCTACGAPVVTQTAPQPPTPTPPQSVTAPATAAQQPVMPQATQKPRRGRRYALIIGVWVVLALLVGGVGLAYGYFTAAQTPAALDLPSTEQVQSFNGYGEPDSWVVAEGPTEPGAEVARIEQWFFYDAGKIIVFVNGVATDALDYTPYDGVAPTNAYSPLDFGSELSKGDVEEMLGETGTPLPDTGSAFDDYEAYNYPEARLLIGYLNGRFYTAQTF